MTRLEICPSLFIFFGISLAYTHTEASPASAFALGDSIHDNIATTGSDLWIDAEQFADGWLYIDWFGWFTDRGGSWISHLEHGYQYTLGEDTSSFYFYDLNMQSWFWTSAELYPHLYKFGSNTGWHWYYTGGQSGNRWFTRSADATDLQEGDINLQGGIEPLSFSLIAEGSFQMGDSIAEGYSDELPVHSVSVSSFYMQRTEVTKAQWDDVAEWAQANGYDISPSTGWAVGPNHPIVSVTWFDCAKFCNALSEREGLSPVYRENLNTFRQGTWSPDIDFSANGYRLPWEAEWEKAARGGLVGKRFPWGDLISHDLANYNASDLYSYETSPTMGHHPVWDDGSEPFTSPVRSFPENGYGLFDMAGNVSEWCGDWHDTRYYGISPESDPTGPEYGTYRAFRGGRWGAYPVASRISSRSNGSPNDYNSDRGFRLALPVE